MMVVIEVYSPKPACKLLPLEQRAEEFDTRAATA